MKYANSIRAVSERGLVDKLPTSVISYDIPILCGQVIITIDAKECLLPISVASLAWWNLKLGRVCGDHCIEACLDVSTTGDACVVITPIMRTAALRGDTDENVMLVINSTIDNVVGHYLAGHHLKQHKTELEVSAISEGGWRRIGIGENTNKVNEIISDELLRGGVVQVELEADIVALQCESTNRHEYLRMLAYQANRPDISLAERLEFQNRIVWHLNPHSEYYTAAFGTSVGGGCRTFVKWSILPDEADEEIGRRQPCTFSTTALATM